MFYPIQNQKSVSKLTFYCETMSSEVKVTKTTALPLKLSKEPVELSVRVLVKVSVLSYIRPQIFLKRNHPQ